MPHPRSTRPAFRPSFERLEDRSNPATAYGLTAGNQLVRFDTANPGVIQASASIQGLNAGEVVVGMDYRPRTGQLYAVAVDGSGTGLNARLLTVNPFNGNTTAVGGGFVLPANQAAFGFGVDFNPTVDLLRVVNTAGANIRVNPNTGAVAGVDVPQTPLAQQIDAAAYDRNFDGRLGANGTTLYVLNRLSGQLQTQGGVNQNPSPNTGVLQNVGPLNVTYDSTSGMNFDIPASGAGGGLGFFTADTQAGAGVTTQLFTVNLTTGAATAVGVVGTGQALTGLAVVPDSVLVAGGQVGGRSVVEVRAGTTGALIRTIEPYPGFRAEIRVATADVNRDSVPDIITGAGPGGGPHVKVFDGVTGAEIRSFYAYDPGFLGGVFVAGGDLNGDGFFDLITGADRGGGPHVRAFNGNTGAELLSFFAYDPSFPGGVRVAAGDFNNDGIDEVVTAAGPTGGPHVKVFDGTTAAMVSSFFAYDAGFVGGVYVAAGDVNGDGVTDIVTGAGTGAGPHVKSFSGTSGAVISSFFAYPESFGGGVRVGVGDRTADGRFEILVTPGGGRGVNLRAFDGPTGNLFDELSGVLSGTDGAFVGGTRV